MLNIIWDTRGYFFWLLMVSLFCWTLERLAPWRKEQRAFRDQFAQDIFWLAFNGHYASVLIAFVTGWFIQHIIRLLGGWPFPNLEATHLLAETPLWLQFIVFFILKDFLDWCVHNLLHRIPLLWEFHKLHHSIKELDWIGNMRFHWMEIVVYKSLTYLPLVLLGIQGDVILYVAVASTLIGHLNHANLKIDWGPLKYVFNSPRLHVWHHDVALHHTSGQNYAIIFSIWDWLFGTIYYPTDKEQPDQIGFNTIATFPRGLIKRLLYPFWK